MSRPEFKKIYDYCRKNRGRVDKILFLRWDRYSRNVEFAFAGNMYKNVKDPNLVCALTGHKEGSKAFNRYRMIDEETNRQTMSYLE